MAMAERKDIHVSASDRTGSDEYTELLCEPCKDDGDHLQAVGFCVDCSEYLCQECYRNHSKNRLSRSHVLQDEREMPKSKPESSKQSLTEGTNYVDRETCDKHIGSMIEFYCRTHDNIGCGTCMFLKHRNCKEIVQFEKEYKKFVDKIDNINLQIDLQIDVQIAQQCSTYQEIETVYSKPITKVNGFITDIKLHIEKLEQEMKLLDNNLKDEKKRLRASSDLYESLKKEVEILSTEIAKCSLNKNRQLFKDMEYLGEQIKRIETTLRKTSKTNAIKIYKFEPQKHIQHIMETIDKLSTIRITEKCIPSHQPKSLKAKHVSCKGVIDKIPDQQGGLFENESQTEKVAEDTYLNEIMKNNAAIIITCFFRKVKERKRGTSNQTKVKAVETKGIAQQLCEITVDDVMCGFCDVYFKTKLREQLEHEIIALTGARSRLNNQTQLHGLPIYIDSTSSQKYTARVWPIHHPITASSPVEKIKTTGIKHRESTSIRLRQIKEKHVQDTAHILKVDEYNHFATDYYKNVAPFLFKVMQFLCNPTFGLLDKGYRETNYPRYMLKIVPMLNKCNLVEKELQLLLSSRLWSQTGHIEQVMNELYTDWRLVEHYVLDVIARLRKEEEKKSHGSSATFKSTPVQCEYWGENEGFEEIWPDRKLAKIGRRRGNRR